MYSNIFSSYLTKKKKVVKLLIDKLSSNFEYVSVLATDVKSTRIRVDKNVTSVAPSSITESGFVIKVKGKETYFEYSVNEIDDKNVDSIAEKVIVESTKQHSVTPVKAGLINDEPLKKNFIRKDTGKLYQEDEIISILKDKVQKYVDETAINVMSLIECSEYNKMFISKNRELTQYYTWTNSYAYTTTRKNDKFQAGYSGNGYAKLEDAINDLDNNIEYSKSVGIMLLDAVAPTPGVYDIITAPSITGLIVHEAFGHGVEMDMYVKDRAKSKEYINKQVASTLVNMHDGAKAALSSASYFFDDDGVLAQDTKIIENGILKRGISDALSASLLNTLPTGNGRRESYKRKAYTRMTNTFFEKGTSSLDDMIKSIKYGYMIFDTNNGMEDPKSWGIQCTAAYGKEIVDGKFTGKIIAPVVMSGYVIDLLESITAISTDFKVIGSGSCGKGYKEWVRVSDGGACLKARVKIG